MFAPKIIATVILFSFLSCNQHPSNKSIVKRQLPTQPDTTNTYVSQGERSSRFMDQERKMYDTMGMKIGEIHFPIDVKPTSSFIPVISIDHPAYILKYLIKGDDVVLPYKKVTLAVEYPVAKPVYFQLIAKGEGFTRREIIEEISRIYHEVYKVEEETSKTKITPIEKRDLLNRNETNGKYGIWGHDLSDLYLNFIDVYKNRDGDIFLDLDIDS